VRAFVDRNWVGYVLSAVFTATAALVRWALPVALTGTPYLAFYPAVVAAAAFGGVGPGLLATVGSFLCVDLMFDATPGWIDYHDPVVWGRMAIFLGGGVGISLLAGMQRAARMREREQTRKLDEAVVLLARRNAELHTALEEVRTAQQEAMRRNEDLQQFTTIASHDLQEPLRVVSGFLTLLEKRYGPQLNDEAKEFIAYSVDGANRMSNLIRGLLEFSRVDRKGGKAEPVDADKVLEAALVNLSTSIREADARITHDPLPTVMADATQLTQLFQNLVGNAVKFRTPDRPCHVHVGAEHRDSRWFLSVRDNGIGIPPDQQARVFRIFERAESREKYPGTGIGLAICKKIVERQGGQIWVESKPGEGSVFFFSLPAAEAPSSIPRQCPPAAKD
jgi:signal transduction histidine kinase